MNLASTAEWAAAYEYSTEELSGGVTKRTKTRKTRNDARLLTGILTLGISEVVGEHRIETYEYYCGEEYLGTTRNEAAESAQKKGMAYFNDNNFKAAEKLFCAAYHACESGYKNEALFKSNMEIAAQRVAQAKSEAEAQKVAEEQRTAAMVLAETEAAAAEAKAADALRVAEAHKAAEKKAVDAQKVAETKAAAAETKAADALRVAEVKVIEAQKIAEAYKAAEMKAALAEIKTTEAEKKTREQQKQHVAKIAEAEEKIAEADKKAVEAEKKAAEAGKRAAEAEKKAEEAEKKAAEAEKKAAEAEKKTAKAEKMVEETENNVPEQNEQYIPNMVAVEKKKTVEERASSSANHWKKAIDKYVTEQPATKVVTRWKMIAEALQLNDLGLKLYREGKLREAAAEIELALDKYEQAVSKFNKACSKQPLDIIFNSFIMVIDAFIKNEAYQEARETIEYAKSHFPDKMDAFTEAEQMMVNENWSPNYTKQYLVQLDERAVENSIKEQSDGY